MGESQTNLAWDVLLDLGSGRGALHERLTVAIRGAIRDGRLPHHTALPPSRVLAERLGVSRWAVTRAYGQLVAECYLEARVGSATRVAWVPEPADRPPAGLTSAGLPPAALPAAAAASPASRSGTKQPRAGDRGGPMPYDMMPFRPDLRAFPRRRWLQALTEAAATASWAELDTPPHGGVPRVRATIAAYLNRVRAAAATPESVHVCFGAGQAMLRICTALREDGHTAIAVEEPGSNRLWHAARLAGLDLVPLPVDEHGFVVDRLEDHPAVRAVCVAAARQCPLGPALAKHRRAALLAWSRRVDGLIVEDDYDAEFRYDRPSTAVMQGMEPRRVALIGSVSQALGPAVGIGWAVTPPRWTATLHDDDRLSLMPTALNQLGLAAMLDSGAYDRHLRAARGRFRARRDALLRALEGLPGCSVSGAESGLNVVLDLPPGSDAVAVKLAARRLGVDQVDLDAFRFRPDPGRPALVLGYGNLADSAVDEGVRLLAEAIATATGQPSRRPSRRPARASGPGQLARR